MSSPDPFTMPLATPAYPEVHQWTLGIMIPRPFEFNGWKAESMAWKTGTSLHSGLSGPMQTTIRGPQASEFISGAMINGSSPFTKAKHAIFLDEDGLVATHGVLQKDSDTQYRTFCGPWVLYLAAISDLEVEATQDDVYIFQVGGPTSLQTLERATGESLRDIAFLGSRMTQVAGVECEIVRVGMSGTLAYELRGPYRDGPTVYDAVYQAGEEFGVQRMGYRTYGVNHIEGGFAQNLWTFIGSAEQDPGFLDFIGGSLPYEMRYSGSVDPTDLRARQRTPVELNWHAAARFDHDFIGRAALEREVANPKRTLVTLRWNPADVVDIYASLLESGEEYKMLELPCTPALMATEILADHVVKDGKEIGVSSGVVYSYFYRQVISHCTLDVKHAQIGTEVTVLWGDFDKRIKPVRATVERFPYLDLESNRDYDLSRLPSGVAV